MDRVSPACSYCGLQLALDPEATGNLSDLLLLQGRHSQAEHVPRKLHEVQMRVLGVAFKLS